MFKKVSLVVLSNHGAAIRDLNRFKQIFKNHKVLNYCGGGIAASLEAFVLYQLGFEDIMIYDNSLSEWAIDENLPIEKD